jgi:hypothetical protein
MELRLPTDKIRKIRKEANNMLKHSREPIPIRKIAALIGLCNSTSQAVFPTRFRVWSLIRDIQRALRDNGNNWNKTTILLKTSRADLQWWIDDLSQWNGRTLLTETPDIVIETDASDQGWGFEVTTPNPNIQINARYWKGQTILIRTDNMTTRAFINKQGGTIHHLHEISTQIHTICQSHRIRLFAEYLPGVENTRADFLSRMKVDRDDWQLLPSIFRYLQRQAKIDLDLFATRRTRQTTAFYSRFPDPEAKGTNAFAHSWPKTGAYANPPWILINKVLQNVIGYLVLIVGSRKSCCGD